ncbi:hypothetical protein QR680_010192 [Steinernema hermaphroditum]|uniref:Uncharacterized protein n=1 Tax=Steinernema hermaphroditum TaxID=289476 RepID=A0AA39MB43_9BILA|nr:hypothetical protein QR680_010192 [Steinernema hermaphroditum]
MQVRLQILGWMHLVSSLICTPILLRMCYVLLAYQKYRRHECYRIIAQLLIFHVFCGFDYVFYALGILLDHDLFGIVRGAHIITIASFCCLLTSDTILALNRFQILTQFHTPRFIRVGLQIVLWIEFSVLLIILFSPFGGVHLAADQYTITYDSSRAFSWIFDYFRFYSSVALSSCSLTIYVVILLFLGYRKYRFKKTKTSKAERSVALQAGLTFLFNSFTAWVYKYCYLFLMEREWTSIVYVCEQMMNFMYVPLIVYLLLNRKLRRQVFFQPQCTIMIKRLVVFTTKSSTPSVRVHQY